EQLHQRRDQPRMMRHQAEGFAVGVGGEGRARRPALLTPDLLTMAAQDAVGLAAQDGDLFLGEAAREEHVTLLVEGPDLLGRELHGVLRRQWRLWVWRVLKPPSRCR